MNLPFSLLFLFVLWCWMLGDNFCKTEPLLFESVGKMASSLSYLHTQIPVNLSEIEDKIMEYRHRINVEFSEEKVFQKYIEYCAEEGIAAPDRRSFPIHPLYQWPIVARAHIHEVDKIQGDLEALFAILPHVPSKTDQLLSPETHEYYSHIVRQYNRGNAFNIPEKVKRPVDPNPKRPKRFAPVAAAAAIFLPGLIGTVMGIINSQKIDALFDITKRQSQQIETLFNTTVQHTDAINGIIDEVGIIQQNLVEMNIFEPAVFLTKLLKTTAEIRYYVHKAVHAIQQAQHRRLAVDFLSATDLNKLFNNLKTKAQSYDCDLVIEKPSDLFQLEVTYFFDGAVVMLLLHTPMTPKDAILRLFRLHPFPLPFFGSTFIIPNVKNDLLAISNTEHRYSMQLSSADLVSCLKVNHVYLCERNGVLARSYTDTCLGSLYGQRYEEARRLCSFIIRPSQEFFYQLQQNWFLAYFPSPQTLPISCRNGTKTEKHFGSAVTKFHLSPGCTLDSPMYKLVSDLSLSIPTDYLHLEMEWDPTQFFPYPAHEVIPELNKLKHLNISHMSLTDLRHNMNLSRMPNFLFHHIHFAANALTISLFLFMTLLCAYRCHLSRQERRKLRQEQAQFEEAALIEKVRYLGSRPGTPPPPSQP
jgi:hypothetical protein